MKSNKLNFDGKRVKAFVRDSGLTREKIVSLVQDEGFQFSTTGLDKIFRNEFPRKDTIEILETLAKNCHCTIADFQIRKT